MSPTKPRRSPRLSNAEQEVLIARAVTLGSETPVLGTLEAFRRALDELHDEGQISREKRPKWPSLQSLGTMASRYRRETERSPKVRASERETQARAQSEPSRQVAPLMDRVAAMVANAIDPLAQAVGRVEQNGGVQAKELDEIRREVRWIRSALLKLLEELGVEASPEVPFPSAVPLETESSPPPAAPPAQKRLKILVIGLKGDQEHNVKKNFKMHWLELTFRTAQDQLGQSLPREGWVVYVSGFSNHPVFHALQQRREAFGKVKFLEPGNKGITAVTGAVQAIIDQERAQGGLS